MSFKKLAFPFRRGIGIVLIGLSLGAFVLTGCDSSGSSSADGSTVEVGFGSTGSKSARSATKANGSLDIGGANGDTLTVHELRFIVDKVKLDGEADSAAFEIERPVFVDLPLNASDVFSVVEGQIPPGTYTEFEFEIEDADVDEGDDDEAALGQLRNEIAGQGFNWPQEDASLVAVSSFAPEGSTTPAPRDTTYFDAEIEVEIDLDDGQSFDVGADEPTRQFRVALNPSSWFRNESGNPLNLSAAQFQNRDELVELEIENELEGESEIDFGD